MKKIKLIALLLAVVLLFAGCAGELEASLEKLGESLDRVSQSLENFMVGQFPEVPNEKAELKFSQMVYIRPDMEELDAVLAEACRIAETEKNANTVIKAVYDFYDVYDNFDTMYCLADILYNQDITDESRRAEYEFCSQNWNYVGSALDELYASLAKSPVLDTLEEDYFGEGFFDSYLPPEGSDEDWEYVSIWEQGYLELCEKESELENQYYTVLEETDYTDAFGNTDYKLLLEKLGPLYVELVKVRKELAECAGFEDTEEYYAQWFYDREETTEQTTAYLESIRTHLVPVYKKYGDDDSIYWLYETRATEKDAVAYVKSAAENMGGIVAEAYGEMEARELYDISRSKKKSPGAYEIYMVDFEAPFILMAPYGDMGDLTGFAHEFGHFTNDYAVEGSYASSDVSEIMSQGLEYLSLSYADSLEPEVMEKLRRAAMCSSLCTYVEQAAYYSFEKRVYSLPAEDLTVEKIGWIYDEVAKTFGFTAKGYEKEEWVEVTHFFRYPFYVYGYVASNDVAMQLYELEREEAGKGLAVYEKLVNMWEDMPLTQYTEEFEELENPIAPGRAEKLAEFYLKQFEG